MLAMDFVTFARPWQPRLRMTSEPSHEFAELFHDSAWLRRFASTLVADRHMDDLVQSTWLAALQRRAVVQSPKRWLRGIARNLARMMHRQEVRSRGREARATRAPSAASPVEIVAQFEARQAVGEALLALPEPTRTIFMLRYYEDLEPAVIARRLALQASTVRQRLHRGRELVRARLHGRLGADWRSSSALLAFAVPSKATLSAAKSVSVASLIAVACVAVCSITAIACLGPGAIRPMAAGTVAMAGVENVSRGAQPVASPPMPIERSLVASDHPDPILVFGVVRDLEGRLVEGAVVRVVRHSIEGMHAGLAWQLNVGTVYGAAAVTDAHGKFLLRVLSSGPFGIVAIEEDRRSQVIAPAAPGGQHELSLYEVTHVKGRLVEIDARAPLEEVPLAGRVMRSVGRATSGISTVVAPLHELAGIDEVITDANGSFRIAVLQGATGSIEPAFGGESILWPSEVDKPIVVRSRVRSITVRVVDRSDGLIIKNPTLRAHRETVAGGADGVIVARVPLSGVVVIEAAGYCSRVVVCDADCVVQLDAAAKATLTFEKATDEPARNLSLVAVGWLVGGSGIVSRCETDDDGRVMIDRPAHGGLSIWGVLSGRLVRLCEVPPGSGELVLPAVSTKTFAVGGVVMDVGGAPAAHVAVYAGLTKTSIRLPWLLDATPIAFTDHAGRFEIPALANLEYQFASRSSSSVATITDAITPRNTKRVKLKLVEAPMIRGRVVEASGKPAAGVFLSATLTGKADPRLRRFGLSRTHARSDSDGYFRIAAVAEQNRHRVTAERAQSVKVDATVDVPCSDLVLEFR